MNQFHFSVSNLVSTGRHVTITCAFGLFITEVFYNLFVLIQSKQTSG